MRTRRTYIRLVGKGSLEEPDFLTSNQINAILEFFEVDEVLAARELRVIGRIEKDLAASGLWKIEIKDKTHHHGSENPVVLEILQKGGEKTWQ